MTARVPTLAAIRRTREPGDADGVIRLLFLRDKGRIGLVQTAQETADNADQFLARYLAEMITDVAAPAVLVTVARTEGRPITTDRQLWTMLTEMLESTSTSPARPGRARSRARLVRASQRPAQAAAPAPRGT